MTLFETSDECPKCGGPISKRPLQNYPVALQIIFGLSFATFLILFDQVKETRWLVWSWSGAQIALGILLVRGRIRAKKRVYHCVRCGAALP